MKGVRGSIQGDGLKWGTDRSTPTSSGPTVHHRWQFLFYYWYSIVNIIAVIIIIDSKTLNRLFLLCYSFSIVTVAFTILFSSVNGERKR